MAAVSLVVPTVAMRTIEVNHPYLAIPASTGRGGFTRTARGSPSLHQIVNGKWRIQSEKEKQRDCVQLQEVKRPRIGEKTENGKCFRFVQQKSVINVRQFVDNQSNRKIKFRPQPHSHERHGVWSISAGQHQEYNANDDG